MLWEMRKIPRAQPEEEVGCCSPGHHNQSIFAWGHHKEGYDPATLLDVASPPLLVSPESSGGCVGFQLGMGLRKSWGKHMGLFGDTKGLLIPNTARAEDFLLPH